MMIVRNSLFASAFACAAFCATAADAQLGWPGPALGWPTDGRLATEKDLVGKKICWDNGRTGIFAANGQFTNERGHHTSWLVTEPGVVKVGDRYTQYLILPDGSFYNHWYHGHKSITGHAEHRGKVCS
jgi:hypothetical protein